MGSDSKKQGVKCRCKKKVKKPEKVPQRGPGVAELEKILGHQPPEQMNPFYGPFMYRHYPPRTLSLLGSHFHGTEYFRRPNDYGVYSNMIRSEQRQEANPYPNYGLSFTQMMTMDDEHPLFQLSMDSVCPSHLIPTANPRLESFAQNFYNKIGKDTIQSLQLGQPQPVMENGKALTVSEQGNTAEASGMHDVKPSDKLTLSLSLGPPNDTERSSLSLPMIPITDVSSESQEGRQMQIFGFNLEEKGLSVDRARLSLGNIAEATSSLEHELDLELKL